MISEQFFASRALASEATATRISSAVRDHLVDAEETAIIVSGGSSPEKCYESLADTALPWNRVNVLLSDDRCVPVEHEASNEGMIRRLLLTKHAANANLIPIYKQDLLPEDQCRVLSEQMDSLPLPFSISLLGMGVDGHFASLFPDFSQLENGLDEGGEDRCLPVQTAASSYQRISLTMATMIQSREILLLFFGDEKREIYERAKRPDSNFPVSRLLQQEQTPVRAFWAP